MVIGILIGIPGMPDMGGALGGGGGAPSTAGEPIGLLLILTKAS